jgi:putative membrane protein
MSQRLALVAGVALLGWLWAGPLPGLARTQFSAHMLLHMSAVAIAAPLLGLAVAGGPWDPARRWPATFNALTASVAELVAVWVWHAPALHHAARTTTMALVAEQASFLVAGLWLWMAACGGDHQREPQRTWTGVAGLLFTSIHMTLLGALFALAPEPVYGHAGLHGSASDQHLGGSLMLLIGGASYLAGGLGLAARGLRTAAPRSGDAS